MTADRVTLEPDIDRLLEHYGMGVLTEGEFFALLALRAEAHPVERLMLVLPAERRAGFAAFLMMLHEKSFVQTSGGPLDFPPPAIAAILAWQRRAAGSTRSIPPRPTWMATFLAVAREVGRRSTCVRALEQYGGIGAVLVEASNHRVLGVGYCGSLPGQPHCTAVGCLVGETGGCQRTIHAEMNALLYAREHDGPKILYSTVSPCLKCLQHALVKGVRQVIFEKPYRATAEQQLLCETMGVGWLLAPRS